MKNELLILEGQWSSTANYSVQGGFDMLLNLKFGTDNAYKYAQAVSGQSFIDQLTANKETLHKYLYIASHGLNDELQLGIDSIKINAIPNLIGNKFAGLYLAACTLGSDENLLTLLSNKESLLWCAGYKTKINWIDSILFDLAFWNEYINQWNQKSPFSSDTDLIINTSEKLKEKYSQVIEHLGFNIAYKILDHENGESSISLAYK